MLALPCFDRDIPAGPIEADSALGPVTAGDWRTASNLFELGPRVHEARCILDSGHVNNRHSHFCLVLHGS